MSEAHVNGTIYSRDEASIIDALLPMFGGYKKKLDLKLDLELDLELEKDGLDVLACLASAPAGRPSAAELARLLFLA